MKASALVLWGSMGAFALTFAADGCGGRAEIGVPNHVEGDGGGSGSSSGVSGSSSGLSGSSSGITGSSSGFTGSSSGMDGSSSGFSGSSSGFSGSSSGLSGSSSGTIPMGANGSIYLEECAASFCAGQAFQAFASFYTSVNDTACTMMTTSGACTYYACPTSQQNGVSAGTISVSDPWLSPPVTMTPGGGTNTYQYMSSSPGFTAGQSITVNASGATVPAFGPEAVVAPQLTEITSPAIATDGGTTTISTGADLQITWSGGQPGATMLLEAVGSNGQDYTYCTWTGSDGQGTIPAAVLKPFSGQSGFLVYGQYDSTSFFAGPFQISLTALPYTGGSVSFQ